MPIRTITTRVIDPADIFEADIYIEAARLHGEDSDPEHELGDLETYFRVAFSLLTSVQKQDFWNHDEVQDTLENAGIGKEIDNA